MSAAFERKTAPDRKAEILQHATRLSRAKHYRGVTREAVARSAGISEGIISHHFGTMAKLKDAVVKQAVEVKDLKIIAQAIVEKHRLVARIPRTLRQDALNTLA